MGQILFCQAKKPLNKGFFLCSLMPLQGYPTFSNLDKIARYFNVSATELFGTPQQIELERVMFQTDEYSRKAEKILSAVSVFENFVKKYDYQKIIEFGLSLKE